MAYIGQKPTDKPLSASDLEDGLITNSKLAQDIISGETELAEAPASTDEFLISDAGVLKRLDASFIGGTNTPSFSAVKDANQDLSDAVTSKITFETEEFDTDSAFASSRFTVPSGKGGKYLITSSIFFTHTSANSLYTINNWIYKNGSVVKADNTYLNYGYTQHTMQVVALLNLSASDYIEIYGASNSNGNTPKVEQNTATFFSGFKLI